MVEWFSSGRRHNPLHRLVSHLDRLLRRRWVRDPQVHEWWLFLDHSKCRISGTVDLMLYGRSVHSSGGHSDQRHNRWIHLDNAILAVQYRLVVHGLVLEPSYVCSHRSRERRPCRDRNNEQRTVVGPSQSKHQCFDLDLLCHSHDLRRSWNPNRRRGDVPQYD